MTKWIWLCLFVCSYIDVAKPFVHMEHHHRHFEEMKKLLNVVQGVIPLERVDHLIQHILRRASCEDRLRDSSKTCETLLTGKQVFHMLNVSANGGLNDPQYNQLCVMLFSEALFMEKHLHSGDIPNSYEEFSNSLHPKRPYHTHFFRGGHLERLLGILQQHDKEELRISGPINDEEKAFSQRNLLRFLKYGGHHSIELVSSAVINYLYKGYCISLDGRTCRRFFIKDIFRQYGNNKTALISNEDFDKLIRKLGIANKTFEGVVRFENEFHDNNRSATHHHHNKREVHPNGWQYRRLHSWWPGHMGEEAIQQHNYDVHHECYSTLHLLRIFTGNRSSDVSPNLLHQICPAILQQIVSGACVGKPHEPENNSHIAPNNAQVYGYGTLAVLIISVSSLFGAILVRFTKNSAKQYVMACMLAMSTGTLCGDAMLHLVPAATGIHAHDSPDHDDHHPGIHVEPYIYQMSAVLASIYAFFILEMIMSKYHDHSNGVEVEERPIRRTTTIDSDDSQKSHVSMSQQHLATNPEDGSAMSLPKFEMQVPEEHHEKSPMSLAWMIIIGDAIHNVADGLAIGAAFRVDITGGLSTSIAIFCHEIPHELGDFAALISTGMSVKKAMLLNLLSAVTAFAGLYIGILIGEDMHTRQWIFAVASGMFIYVALANIVPELMRYFKRTSNWIMFMSQNIGFLFGYASMALIAIFEGEIHL